MVAFRFQVVFECPFANRETTLPAILVGGPIVDAAEYPAHHGFLGSLRKCGEAAGDSGKRVRSDGEGYAIGAIEPRQNRRRCRAERAVTGNVLRKPRCADEWGP